VPPALLELGCGEVLVLEPRRIAARMAARRVAAERGEQPGETVGYQVRFESVGGPRTRLRYLTEGVLTRRLISDPMLERAGVVVLDEFHERHLAPPGGRRGAGAAPATPVEEAPGIANRGDVGDARNRAGGPVPGRLPHAAEPRPASSALDPVYAALSAAAGGADSRRGGGSNRGGRRWRHPGFRPGGGRDPPGGRGLRRGCPADRSRYRPAARRSSSC